MPQIQCPSCLARMNAPDTAIGKLIKCPKCAEPFVSADEPEETAPLKRKSRAVYDDDDFEDPRPQTRKRKKKPAAIVPIGVWIGAGLAVCLLLVVGMYFATRGGKSASKPPEVVNVPVVSSNSGSISDLKIAPMIAEADREIRWVPFSAPDRSFNTAFPDGEPEHNSSALVAAYTRLVGQRQYAVLSVSLLVAGSKEEKSAAEVYAESILNKLKIGEEDETGKIISIERTTVAGIVAVKSLGLKMGKATVKCSFCMKDSYFTLIVSGEASMTANDRHVVAFQSKFAKGG